MLQTLFHFRLGWLWAAWAVAALAGLAWGTWRQGLSATLRNYLPSLAIVGLIVIFLLPRLSDSEGLPIRGYGAMLLVALVSGVGLAMRRARRMGVDPDMIQVLAFWMVLAGIAGARAFYVIQYWHQFRRVSLLQTIAQIANFTEGGIVVYGSALGAGLALLVFVYKHNLPGLALADLISPSVMLGLAFGRLGCFLNGCCFGGYCDEPWAVRFPPLSPAFHAQAKAGTLRPFGLVLESGERGRPIIKSVEPDSPAARAGLIPGQALKSVVVNDDEYPLSNLDEALIALQNAHRPGDKVRVYVAGEPLPATWTVATSLGLTSPIHPAQIYAAVDGFLMCLLLLAYYPYRRRDGEVFALMITIHPISRFLQEATRADEAAVFGSGMTISQNASILMIAGALGLWFYISRRPKGSVWPVKV